MEPCRVDKASQRNDWKETGSMENRQKAKRILAALDSCRAPITWHCIDEEEIIGAIARELDRIEREERSAE